ncbi:D-arabinose dehydrogenase [NAD(P)+] heavy chain [[Candida] railenensis]|uniref:D-arabinose dehydrogenase [NAD(P)+] heavy chain n=1 Tax=[Candida] railenensis TaxID=45579 RepID=A0A9P0VX07_9ASCO|nr:D-arabinose dehydrogenase [NAD(P)+] heavy chain [[Candida] railenensis]
MSLATTRTATLNNGKKIPLLGLGTVPSNDNPAGVKDQVIAAVKAGYRHIDCAWFYGTEKYVGQALSELFKEGVVKREDLFITTKVWPSYYHSPEKSLDASLKDLQIDYVDLLLQHWPICLHGDENGLPSIPKDKDGNIIYDDDPASGTKFISVYHSMEDLLDRSTKVRSIGVSNYSISKLKQLLPEVKKHIPVVDQIEYHPKLPQQDLVDFAQENGILIEAYSPVGSEGAPVLKLPLVKSLAEKYNVTVNEVAYAYHILNGRAALPRSSNLERISTNINLPSLTREELDELYALGKESPERYINDPWGYGLGFKWWKGDTLSK